MDRRGFLRGTLLSAPAVMLGPGVVDLVGGNEGAEVALLSKSPPPRVKSEETDFFYPTHMGDKLTARINAYGHMAGEPPKIVFVNRYEFRALVTEMSPLRRFQDEQMAKHGVNNLLWRGVPIACVDSDTLYLEVE